MSEDYIFKINEDKPVDRPEEDVLSAVGYTSGSPDHSAPGSKEIDPEDPKCYAKKVKYEKSDGGTNERYYVKYGDKGFMYDPWGLYTERTESKKLYGDKSTWYFRKVNRKSFFYYLDFLKTRNKAWLHNAEREAINGY